MTKRARVGVDIGGTFTDVALEVGDRLVSTKVLTTYDAPERAILAGLAQAAEAAGIGLAEIGLLIHGTTLATNALLERRGAKTAFLTTEGFRDVVEMRTENRFEQYDLNLVLPAPLVSREHRYVAGGRLGPQGRELAALDAAAVARFADRVVEGGYESVAIGFLHAYANPAHERAAREIVAARAPGVPVSISAEVSPQMREFERFNTVCANAYVAPLMASYLSRLEAALRAEGVEAPLFLMHSGGGLIDIQTAIAFPVRLLESGPAGGAIFAADVARRYGIERALSFDMGGTTAKICLIERGTPKTARSFEAARTYRFKKGSGTPLSIPVIEMVEIGAGGGSLASVDGLGRIQVGPESAGSEPGPACYGRSGERPAVTDADLVLGRIDPVGFAGGSIVLDGPAARGALERSVGAPLGLDAEGAAAGVLEVVDEAMANAARAHAVETGEDLSGYAMIAFGGAAPLHAARLCEKLGVSALIVPPGAGVGSAIGFLRAPFGFEAVRGAYLKLSQFDAAAADALLAELEAEAAGFARAGASETGAGAALTVERKAYMRYAGQGWEATVPLPDGPYGPEDGARLRAAFEAVYARLYGRVLEGLDVEVMNWSVTAATPTPATARAERSPAAGEAVAAGTRPLYDALAGETVDAGVVARAALRPGDLVSGPAAIAEAETTTILTSGFEAVMQADGCLVVARKEVRS